MAVVSIISRHYADGAQEFWRWWGIASFLLVGPSLGYSLWIWRRQGKIDVDISKREDRVVPLMLSSLGAVIGSFLIFTRLENSNLLLLSFVLTVTLVALTIITASWKVSLHTATWTSLVTFLVLFINPLFGWLYLVTLPIAWARLILKQHTKLQLIGGALVGTTMTALVLILFGRN